MDIINEEVFNEKLKNEEVILVDFWAPWCGPCRMLTPTIDKLKEQYFLNTNLDYGAPIKTPYNVVY